MEEQNTLIKVIVRQVIKNILQKNKNSAYQSDIEGLLVFCYDDGECYKFYIPDEIKKIIKKLLKI